MEHNLYDSVAVAATITPIVGNNDTEGTGVGVDLKGYSTAVAVFHCGISGDVLSGALTLQAILQESDDNITFTAVAAGDLEGSFTLIDDPAEDDVVQVVGYKGAKRYLRLFVDFTGTHTVGTPISAVIVRSRPRHIGTVA